MIATAVLAGGIVGALVMYALLARPSAETRAQLAAATARAERLAEEAEDLRERAADDQDVLRALAPLRSGLDAMARQVTDLERERVAQFATLDEHLRHTGRASELLRKETAGLASALRSTSARGHWGEVELRRVVEAAGMLRRVDFHEQTAVASGSRPDMTVTLPGGRSIPLDAKVPFDAYLAAEALEGSDAEVEARRAELLAEHSRRLRAHVDELARRNYHGQLGADVTVLFIPSESLLGAALTADPGLLEHALRKGIAPTSPASLLALLRAVAAVWERAEISERAAELLVMGRTLYERLGTVAGHLGAVGKSLTASVAAYNKAVASFETRLLVTAREFDALDVPLERIAEVDANAREFTRAELTA